MEEDRIMAGQNHIRQNHQWQNHAAPPLMVLPARILSLLRMILSGHDSVGLLRLCTKPSQLAHKLVYGSARKGTWERDGLHPPGNRARSTNRLFLFAFFAFSVVKLLRLGQLPLPGRSFTSSSAEPFLATDAGNSPAVQSHPPQLPRRRFHPLAKAAYVGDGCPRITVERYL